MDVEVEVTRLRSRVRWLTGFLSFATVGLVVVVWLRGEFAAVGLPHVRRDGQVVVVTSSNDGPFVITHLIASGTSEAVKRWAAIDPPVAYIDSGGARISLEGLHWRDSRGEPADPPSPNAPLRVLYVVPAVASERAEH
jgi:hypothetical protein